MIIYLDGILIYTKGAGQAHVNVVQWVLNKLMKHVFFAMLKKCRFHKDKVRFLGYVMLAQAIKMEDKQLKVVAN